jgi:VanZ family protein
MNQSKNILRLWVSAFFPVLVWAGFIFFLSSQSVLPGIEETTLNFIFKKLSHITVYAVLYFLLYRGVLMTFGAKKATVAWAAPLVICLAYAITDEIHQSFVPGRYPTTTDIGYDMIGASVALLKTMNCI